MITFKNSQPRYAGRWVIGGAHGLSVAVGKRPRWVTRFLCRVLLEWQWVDISDDEGPRA